MLSLYLVLKFIHIFSAIVAVGANITYVIWDRRAARDPTHMDFALKGVKFIDDRVANPAYGVLLITGLAMVFVGHWPITTLWIVLALLLFAALIAVAVVLYSPLLRDQVRLVEAGETSSPAFTRLARRNAIVGPAIGVIVLGILAMMVFKPHL